MSIGYSGLCKKYIEDDNYVIYTYSALNLNIEYPGNLDLQDGKIYIDKTALPHPIIHIKNIKKPNGRKQKIKKIIPISFDLEELLITGNIKIEPSKTDFKNPFYNLDNYIAHMLTRTIIDKYQLEGFFDDKYSYHV